MELGMMFHLECLEGLRVVSRLKLFELNSQSRGC